MSWQHEDGSHHRRFDVVPHRSLRRRFKVSSMATTTAPTRKTVKAYGPSQPQPMPCKINGATTAPTIKALPMLFASRTATPPNIREIACRLRRTAARGDAILTLASFALIAWSLLRGAL